jgi:hypothetical protein
LQYAGGDVGKVLPRLHQVQIELGRNLEQLQHLIEHLAVLGGHAHAGIEGGVGLEGFDQGGHFDGFGAGAEDEEDFLNFHIFLLPWLFAACALRTTRGKPLPQGGLVTAPSPRPSPAGGEGVGGS